MTVQLDVRRLVGDYEISPLPAWAGWGSCTKRAATTCPFAENVFVAYYDDDKANGVQSNNTVDATSPVTHQTYAMSCCTDGVTVTCTGGTDSFVTFPLHAVEVY